MSSVLTYEFIAGKEIVVFTFTEQDPLRSAHVAVSFDDILDAGPDFKGEIINTCKDLFKEKEEKQKKIKLVFEKVQKMIS